MAPYYSKPLVATLFISLSALLSSCNSGSSGGDAPLPLASRAIDGYLVGSQVFCDDVANGGTTNGATKVVRVRGGSDVGFDETADTGGTPFIGELSAPANLGFVTPLSSLAMHLSTNDQGYDASLWDQSVETLTTGLGQSSLDLSADAASVMQLIRLNAQIHQVVNSFTANADDYVIVSSVFAHYLEQQSASGQSVSLDDGVDQTVTALNEQLLIDEPRLHLSPDELQRTIDNISSINIAIAQSLTPEPITNAVAGGSSIGAVAAFDRQKTLLTFLTENYWSGSVNVEPISIEDFESAHQVEGQYKSTITGNPNLFRFNRDALVFKTELENQRISMAISIKATDPGDTRSLSLVSHDLYISNTASDWGDIQIDFKDDSLLHASGISSNGVETTTSVTMKENRTFYTDGNYVGIHTYTARQRLRDLGFQDIFYQSGNFEVTLIIGGLQVNEINDGVETIARSYTVEAGDQILTGSGFQGFISYIY